MDMGAIQLAFIDKAIIIGYFVLIMVVGFIMSKIASKGISNYFLGGKTIPWWVLGASGTASNFDVAGTTVIVAFVYMLGLKGFWIAMRGGAAIPLAFLMVFLGKWYRRSKVMTEAEFMKFRFGDGPDGKAARTLAAIAQLLFCTGMIIYFSKGVGIFLSQFLPFSPAICSAIMVAVGLAYTVSSGLYGVVFTDVLQEILIIIVAIFVSVKAFFLMGSTTLTELMGSADKAASFSEFSLPFTLSVPDHPEFNMFTFAVGFFILKGVLEGLGGIGGYMSQRYYAARNEREAGLLTAEWILLLAFRWTMIMGLALLGWELVKNGFEIDNAEKVLSLVVREQLPDGIRGMAVAGLIAAAMSTFDSTVNAGASYWVKDIYQAIINPEASDKQLMLQSRMSSLIIAVLGFFLSLTVNNINEIWTFITACLGAALFIPMVMRWYWHRFNGWGFAWGVGVGLVGAIILRVYDMVRMSGNAELIEQGLKPVYQLPPYITFPVVFGITIVAAIIATLSTTPTDPKVLEQFYRQIRVGGAWGRVKYKMSFEFIRQVTIEHLNDIISVVLAIVAQMTLLFGSMVFVLHDWVKFCTCMIIFSFCSIGLYFFWYKNLRGPEETGEAEDEAREMEELEGKAREIWKAEQEKYAEADS